MQLYTAKVIETIAAIPEGSVMSYGQIAKVAGNARGARQVVRILHSMSVTYSLPWHRVVNAKGEIALPEEDGGRRQRSLLEQEGVQFTPEGRIDLARYRYHPDETDPSF